MTIEEASEDERGQAIDAHRSRIQQRNHRRLDHAGLLEVEGQQREVDEAECQ